MRRCCFLLLYTTGFQKGPGQAAELGKCAVITLPGVEFRAYVHEEEPAALPPASNTALTERE